MGPFRQFLGRIRSCCGCLRGLRRHRTILSSFCSDAGGSGIQYVEAAWREEVEPARFKILLVKFFGGILTLGSGMALGREGPTVQMGASIGATIARILKFSKEELRFLTIASAGTGLGVAFSSPLGGAMFTFEEVTKDIRMNLVIPTLICVLPAARSL